MKSEAYLTKRLVNLFLVTGELEMVVEFVTCLLFVFFWALTGHVIRWKGSSL